MKTMGEVYGEQYPLEYTDHKCCDKCELCITCGDCKTSGCGSQNNGKGNK